MPRFDFAGPDHDPAIRTFSRAPLTYGQLTELMASTRATLSGAGAEPDSVLAIVLPSGPALAALFLAISETCAAAPLNPGLTRQEFEFLLADLGASALITQPDFCPAAVAAAQATGVPIVWLCSPAEPEAPAGTFGLMFDEQRVLRTPSRPLPPDTVLLLHTSGTTAKPKLVPLTHDSLVRSACDTAKTLALGPDDCSLIIMPLFHVHGLVAGLLAPLMTGGSVFCTPKFDAFGFFAALKAAGATWYTGVPTMHQAVLSRAERHQGEKYSLRFVRSCSAQLPARVSEQLEDVFQAPVISAYGMTEAAHQIASNPLPPGSRKLGSVGCASGVEIAILDDRGRPLPPGAEGEVALRGERVMRGYVDNPEANCRAFINGWFLTGDLGQQDAQGYLTLNGRLKEIINCGGEKISPLEIDTVLLEHPDIEQALAFPIPHQKLGEAVAAAVVLRQGSIANPSQIRKFVAQSLASFKVPSQIVFVPELPKGPTGKFQRNRVASALGLS